MIVKYDSSSSIFLLTQIVKQVELGVELLMECHCLVFLLSPLPKQHQQQDDMFVLRNIPFQLECAILFRGQNSYIYLQYFRCLPMRLLHIYK